MCSGPNENDPPCVTTRTAGSPPIRGFDSRTAPRTTRTAPEEMSWSCQPVSSLARPAQQPHVDVLVPVQFDVVPLLALEHDVLAPPIGVVCQRIDKRL